MMNISYNRLLLFYRVEQHVFQIAQKIGHALYVTQLCRAILTHFPIFRKSQMKTNFVNVGPQNCQLPGGNGLLQLQRGVCQIPYFHESAKFSMINPRDED